MTIDEGSEESDGDIERQDSEDSPRMTNSQKEIRRIEKIVEKQ